ncbi:activating signal cointegrator 1 complex subunit 1 [Condylostylus longicornis]|uniref:activating signal cointegrator 1 complex subunit 1 n=1 Tax=Condylostylus longicornis TaxID=2530218 RepID=UPI00244E346A|nr:activating signal cointegrator 1 complex subunit 1 [Condylostylus longicornis]
MDILKPEILQIGKRMYRLNSYRNYSQIANQKHENDLKSYVEEDLYSEDEFEEREITFKNGQFEYSFHIPSLFYSHIIGTKGTTKKRIESQTNTRIIVPKLGTQGDITVLGKSRSNVNSACRKIDLVVLASRSKIPSTHFVNVPFNNTAIMESYKRFRNEVITHQNLTGLDPNFFIQPEKLHLTLTVLSLIDDNDRLMASQILNECEKTFIRQILKKNDGEIYLHLKGLEIMNDDPSSVEVLYGVVKSEGLQEIADGILDLFCKNNLTQRKTDNVKLHVTLINSKFSQKDDDNTQRRITFDAKDILQKYIDYDFGIQKLHEIHLSQRFSTGSDGFYEATSILKLY